MPPPDRLPGIEGLRALAATAVVVHHTWILPGGERVGADAGAGAVFLNLALGVTLFFALSGYLLYRPFAAAIARRAEMPRIRRYLRNRGLRILPAYWAILLATSLLLMTAGTREAGGRLEFGVLIDPLPLLKAALLIHNYHPDTVVIGIGPAWSLAVEAVFYVVLPLMALVAARAALRCRARSGRVIVLLAPPLLLLLIGLSGKYMAGVVVPAAPGAGYGANWHSVIERSFWAQADLFAFGMLTAVLHTEITDGRFVLPRGWRVVALALAVAIFAPCALSLDSGQLGYRLENTAVGLAAALLIAAVTFPGGAGARAVAAAHPGAAGRCDGGTHLLQRVLVERPRAAVAQRARGNARGLGRTRMEPRPRRGRGRSAVAAQLPLRRAARGATQASPAPDAGGADRGGSVADMEGLEHA